MTSEERIEKALQMISDVLSGQKAGE